MSELKTCIVCLSTHVKLFPLGDGELRNLFNTLSGIKTEDYKYLPNLICYICLAYVRHFKAFRKKCQRSYLTFATLRKSTEMCDYELTEKYIDLLDRNTLGVKSSIDFQSPNANVKDFEFNCTITTNTIISDVYHEINESNIGINSTIKCETEWVTYKSDDDLNLSDNNSDSDKPLQQIKDIENKETDDLTIDNHMDVVPLTLNEQKAVFEIVKASRTGSFPCSFCDMAYNLKIRLKSHERIHDKHISGPFICEICNCCYKTDLLLQTHMADKHMYKYLCKMCNAVFFTKVSAKKHHVWVHTNKERSHGKHKMTRNKKAKKKQKTQNFNEKMKEFLTCTPVSQTDQYRFVLDRQKSKNYTSSAYTCDLCYKGFRSQATYENHAIKHNPNISGNLQCDMCKIYTKSKIKMHTHMRSSHVHRYNCIVCAFETYNGARAILHYKWHKKVTYTCPHCDKEFMKMTTYMTHIRIKHPSTVICQICGHSFVSDIGLTCHKRIAHSKEEVDACEDIPIDHNSQFYCRECQVQFVGIEPYNTHLQTSSNHSTINKERLAHNNGGRCVVNDVINNGLPTSTTCDVCGKVLPNDVQTRKHYKSEHPGHQYLKRYMCDVCGHTTKQYANLINHMRSHTKEKPYPCPHCDRRFSSTSNRDSHLIVHTGEKRYQCHHCNRRFTQSGSCKLHIQTVHMKIPYAPWDKAQRRRRARQAAERQLDANQPSTFYEIGLNEL